MSVSKVEPGVWRVRLNKKIPGRSPLNINRIVKGTKLEAQDQEYQWKKELQLKAKKHLKSISMLNGQFTRFGQAVEYYEKTHMISKKSAFNRVKEHLYNSRLTAEVGEQSIWDDLVAFRERLLEEGLKPSTVNRQTSMAQGIITHAKKNRKIPINYLSEFGQLFENNIKYRILTNSERYELFKYLPDYLKPLVYFAMRVPVRIGELLKLTSEHINSDCTEINLNDTKNKSPRWLPLFDEMKPFAESIKRNNQKYLFSKDGVTPLGDYRAEKKRFELPSKEYRIYNQACADANIKGYNFHKTCQQASMQFLYDGYSEKMTMHIGGWKTIEAFNRYVRIDDVLYKKEFGIFTDDDAWKKDLAPKSF